MGTRHGSAAVGAAIIAVLLLAGCAPADDATPAQTSSPAPVATPVATPVEEPAVGPSTVFDGDCARLFTVGEASAVLGVQAALAGPMYEAGDIAIRQLGGMHCVWHDPAQQAGSSISVVILPSRVRESDQSSCDREYQCAFFATASGFDLYGVVRDDAVSDAVLLDRIASASAAFTAAVVSETVPEPYVPGAAWSIPVDCAGIDPDGVVADLLGDPAVEGFATGGDAEPNGGFYVAFRVTGAVLCAWSTESGSILAEILPGGSWVEGELRSREGASVVSIAGVESALLIVDTLHVFDGDNCIALVGTLAAEPADEKALGLAAAGLVAVLNA